VAETGGGSRKLGAALFSLWDRKNGGIYIKRSRQTAVACLLLSPSDILINV
jgi:hypothetical protein